MPSQDPQFTQKPDVPHRWGLSKNLESKEVIAQKITGTQGKAQGGFKKLTL
jgi:hypothetical protein